MDSNTHKKEREHQDKHYHEHPEKTPSHSIDQFPSPPVSEPSHVHSLAEPDQNTRDSIPGTDSHVHLSTPEMGDSDGYRRRRALLADEYDAAKPNGMTREKNSKHIHPKKMNDLQDRATESGDEHTSEISYRSTSDDVELRQMGSESGLTDDEEVGLAQKDRRHRKRKKQKNTLLHQRVMGVTASSNQNETLANRSVLKASLINALLIASWYFFSLSISIYNKWMFSKDHLNFHFPLFTTCVHMVVQFSLASIVLYFMPRFRPRHISSPYDFNNSQSEPTEPKKPLMTRMFYATRIGPCGAATGLDIGLGNTSLKFISLTFFTMCKSSSLAFVLLFAFLFHLEQPSVKLILIIATMTIGVVMMVAGETAFNALGFILIISSAFFSGFRWALTQILLLRNPATSNPFSSIFFLAPIMFFTLAIIAIPVEGFVPLGQGLRVLTAEKGPFVGIGILLFPGALAFLMTASEFALLKRTSVVTLSICGIFKEVVTISAAGIVFHDPLTPINVSGLMVTIGSIAAYNYIKIVKMRDDARALIEQTSIAEGEAEGEASQPMLHGSETQHAGGEGSSEILDDRDLSVAGKPAPSHLS